MRSWAEVAEVTAAQRAAWIAATKAGRPDGWTPVNEVTLRDGLDVVEAARCPPDTEHPDMSGGYGPGDRGEALRLARRLSQLDAERATITAEQPARASDDRKRTARLRSLDTELEHLGTQLDAATRSWWPEQPRTGRTAARTAARPGLNGPGRRSCPVVPVSLRNQESR